MPPATHPPKRIPLRRSLVMAAVTVALESLLAFVLALYAFVLVPASEDLAKARLRIASDQVEARMAALVTRVEAIVQRHRDWGQRGLLDIDEVQRFNDMMRPMLQYGPQLSSMVLATPEGRNLMLLRDGDGWLNRIGDPLANPGQARFIRWDARNQRVSDDTRPFEYDPRARPWYRGAIALARDEEVYWSDPYNFRTDDEPGLSVVVRWKSPEGQRYVMSSDIRLVDLSRFTRDTVAGEHGFVSVLTQEGLMLGVPRVPALAEPAALRQAVLKEATHIGVAPLAEAVRLWRESGAHDRQLLRFDVGREEWLATFTRFPFGGQNFWIATMAPESDFTPGSTAQACAVAAIALGTLLLAAVIGLRLARRFVEPLEALAEQSKRIGHLELDKPAQVHSRWIELDTLGQAQESMRLELLAATQRLEQANNSLEAKVEVRTRQLAEAKDAADAASRAKAEFLANMSHEIRTPMNAVLGMTDLALRTELTPRQQGYLQKAKVAADSLLGILNDILDFSKVEAGKLQLEAREFSLQGVFDRVTAVVGLKAHEKGLELLMNTSSEVPALLVGDVLRLEQVLINLCSNAVKFTDGGEIVVVTVKSVRETPQQVTLRFSVRDTGIGLSEEQVAGLFQPFNQLDASTTRRHGGTGLGLAICKSLVALMGGEIGVRSQLGRGSDFFFTASFGRSEDAGEPMPGDAAGGLREDLRVLVVDDSANSREIFQDLLSRLGCRPTLVGSGSDGLAELQRALSAGRPYELLLLDWKMPGMDGFEMVQRLRQVPALAAGLKVVLVTAYGDEELVRRAVREQLDGCLSKPVSPSSLLDGLLAALGSQAAATASRPPLRQAVPASLRGRSVLLVEDNEFNQLLALELLREVAGMEVTLATNGQEALDRLQAGHFDLVLMDVQMPVMDGYEATLRIRQQHPAAVLPVIAMTAHAMLRDREKSLAVGMNDHVSKPFDPHALFAVLAKWIERRATP